MLSKEMLLFLALFAFVQTQAECGLDAEGRSTCPDEVDEANLLQAKVKVATRTETAQEVELNAGADPATTKVIAGVPIYNYHLLHEGGMNPSLLELSQEKNFIVLYRSAKDADKAAEHASAMITAKGHPDRGGIPYLEVKATQEQLEKMMEEDPGIAIEPDMTVEAPDPNEELGSTSLLGLSGDDVPWGLDRIDDESLPLDETYQMIVGSKQGEGVHVYVADTGVRTTHVDFEGRAIPTIDCARREGGCQECNGDTNCAVDGHGHGTHCAGTIGGKKYGVAKKATIHGVKVLNPSGYTSWILNSLDWIETKGQKPAIWSASLGGPGRSEMYKAGIEDAVSKGIVVSIAAGNSNADACNFSPAFVGGGLQGAVTVGSTTRSDTRSGFSNYGTCIDIYAPGSSIVSAGKANDQAEKVMSGTSMACPHVSGVLALMLADNMNDSGESLSPAQAEALLLQTAVKDKVQDAKEGSPNLLLNSMYGEAPPPPTAPPGETWELKEGDCTISEDRKCVSSPNYPLNYGPSQKCKLGTWGGKVKLTVEKFGTEKQYDKLTVNGQDFSGDTSPNGVVTDGTLITWSADYSVPTADTEQKGKYGWKFCAGGGDDGGDNDSEPTAAPTNAPTAAPTTAAPTTAAPTTAAPTPDPALEQALDKVDDSIDDLRNDLPAGQAVQQAWQNVQSSVAALKIAISQAVL